VVWPAFFRIQKGDVNVIPLVCVQERLALVASLRVLAEANYFVVHYGLSQELGLHPACQVVQIVCELLVISVGVLNEHSLNICFKILK